MYPVKKNQNESIHQKLAIDEAVIEYCSIEQIKSVEVYEMEHDLTKKKLSRILHR